MPKNEFVDFKAVKSAVSMEQALQHYGLLENLKRSGDSLTGACPIHRDSNPTQFRVSLGKNLWNCFSDCKGGGNVLDFIEKMEDISIHAAAVKAVDWFGLDRDSMSAGCVPASCQNENLRRCIEQIAAGLIVDVTFGDSQ